MCHKDVLHILQLDVTLCSHIASEIAQNSEVFTTSLDNAFLWLLLQYVDFGILVVIMITAVNIAGVDDALMNVGHFELWRLFTLAWC